MCLHPSTCRQPGKTVPFIEEAFFPNHLTNISLLLIVVNQGASYN